MAAKRRKTTKSSTKSTEQDQDIELESASRPQPVTVSIPEPSPVQEPMEAPSARFIPVEEAPMPTAPEKPVVIARSQRSQPQPSLEPERIGDILRRVRQSRREALEDIADYLRIRPGFLSALEASAYEQLPADAYVIGFLRTYANYLGLDGRAAIDQYRHEMSGRRNKPQLTMPQPVSEGPAPTVAILVSALLAALLLYALWYAFASADRAEVSTTPPLPQAAVVEEKPAEDKSVTLQPAPGAEAQPAPQQQPTDQPAAAPAQPEAAQPPATAPEKSDKPQAAAPQTAPAQPAPAQPAPAEAAQNEVKQEEGKTYGAQPSRARVSIKATRNSWILVTDERGNTVFDRTLKPGETYYAPADKPLLLTTGNGKGLQLTLDGAALPTIGTDGNVVRGLPLDAEKLKEKLGAAGE